MVELTSEFGSPPQKGYPVNDIGPTTHEFGGPWTEVKLDAISEYLDFFTNALKAKPTPTRRFLLWYIDAFAGTGRRTARKSVGGLFDGGGHPEEVAVELDGSARRALAIEPPFSRMVFIEKNARRVRALQALNAEFPERTIQIHQGDSNVELQRIFSSWPWSAQPHGRGLHRGVVFLDPYSMSVRWETLRLLADTGAVDVWYLFPLSAVVRQLAADFHAIDAAKEASLDQIFGTREWRNRLYSRVPRPSVFGEETISVERTATQRQIELYARERLQSLFGYVSDPLPLLMPRGAQLFSLFCMSGSDSIKARLLMQQGVSHVLKKYG